MSHVRFSILWVTFDVCSAWRGVLTSDPRLVDNARPVPLLTYEEATELAFFGATVLHPLAMQPALQSEGLAVRVKNSYNRCPHLDVSPFARRFAK